MRIAWHPEAPLLPLRHCPTGMPSCSLALAGWRLAGWLSGRLALALASKEWGAGNEVGLAAGMQVCSRQHVIIQHAQQMAAAHAATLPTCLALFG